MRLQKLPEASAPKIAVYTAICGGKDYPRDDIEVFDYYPFMTLPVHQAKVFKILSHQFKDDADISVWLDGNIKLLIEPERLVEEWLGDYDIALFKHPSRDCIYDEVNAIRYYYGDVPLIQEQVDYYRSKGHPPHWGMGECNVLVRRHNDRVKRFNNAWWSEICRWSWRDQLSFPYVARTHPEVRIRYISPGYAANHPYFLFRRHAR